MAQETKELIMQVMNRPMEVGVVYSSASDLLHKQWMRGFPRRIPIDVEQIAYELGIRVVEDASLEKNDIIGAICFEGDGPTIKINPYQNSYIPRRRFTIAHEIGHYCLHMDSNGSGFVDSKKTMSRTDSYWDQHESQANTFAAQLLMPSDMIISAAGELLDAHSVSGGKGGMLMRDFVDAMAKHFNVSGRAMEYRLTGIGII